MAEGLETIRVQRPHRNSGQIEHQRVALSDHDRDARAGVEDRADVCSAEPAERDSAFQRGDQRLAAPRRFELADRREFSGEFARPRRRAGTGKSHMLIALGHAAVHHGRRVRYFAAADLVETLYRGLADNTVARQIDTILRADLIIVDELGFAPLDLQGGQLLFRFVTAAYERRSLAIASHWPFDAGGRFLPEHTTATSLLDRLLHHAVVVVTEGDSYRMREARQKGGRRSPPPPSA